MTFVRSLSLTQLGTGAGFAIWGFRAIAIGHANCCALMQGYDRAFGDESRAALGGLHMLAREIGHRGGRKVSLATPGCCSVTSDELSVIAALAAAQEGDIVARDAHLRWLTAGRTNPSTRSATDTVAYIFAQANIPIHRPQIELIDTNPERTFRSYHEAGNA